MWIYRLAVFLAAFLLFQIQPMMAKALLPAFGGSYLVWAVCMLFFQAMLLSGYLYAHLIQRRLGIFKYSRWHWLLLFLPFIVFPFKFDQFLINFSGTMPIIEILRLLLVNSGLPFLSLATASLILQSWLYTSSLAQRKNPYVLYSASNLGSMLALLSYPIIFEPLFDLKKQGHIWWVAYILLLVLYLFCMPKKGSKYNIKEEKTSLVTEVSSRSLNWFLLSAAACFSLLAVTNILTFELVVVPFLWVLPLSVYLLTFVLTFKQRAWYPEWVKEAFGWCVPIGILLYLMNILGMTVHPIAFILSHLAILFIVCMNCNGRLIQIKPDNPARLTSFYLALAAGGLAGSVLVSVVVPFISTSLVEYPLSFFIASLSLGMALALKKEPKESISFVKILLFIAVIILTFTILPKMLHDSLHLSQKIIFCLIAFLTFMLIRRLAKQPLVMAIVVLAVAISSQWTTALSFSGKRVASFRNFYGVYTIYDVKNERYLKHGTTLHGRQYLTGPKVDTPLLYYHPTTPAGEMLSQDLFNFSDIAMIGLGPGALTAYMKSGQSVTIYELDPDNLGVAEDFFTHLKFSRENGANQKFIFGDGRVSLRKAKDASYDLLIIDAFNSGAIPVHLLTIEAFEEYFRTLRPDGFILVHISNKMLNLSPVLYNVAEKSGFYACEKDNAKNINKDAEVTFWMTLCRSERTYKRLLKDLEWVTSHKKGITGKRAWSDQYTNILNAIR